MDTAQHADHAASFGFGVAVTQAVAHLNAEDVGVEGGFGGTVIQVVVHPELASSHSSP